MDTNSRLSQLLSSTPVVPDYSRKWSVRGRKLFHNPVKTGMSSVTDNTVVLDVGQPSLSVSPLTGLKFQLAGVGEIEMEPYLLDKLALYNLPNGFPELRKLLFDIQRREHSPPQHIAADNGSPSNFDLTVSCGITEALNACVDCILDEEDTILVEDISYTSFLLCVRTLGANIQGVPFDDDGIVTEALEDTLKNWEQRHPGRKMPKMLYTVALANNPLGYNWTLDRMLEVYSICRKYDILIMDDGAYHFLQFGERARSFQSLDVDGRVIRFDTFSKIIGAGYRLGWMSGPTDIVDKVNIRHESTCQQSGFLAQAVIYSMLKKWGKDGFEARVKSVAKFYEKKAEYASNACDKYLSDHATWTLPKGGMFMWISLKDCDDSHDIITRLKEEYDVRVVRGNLYKADPRSTSHAFRLCYSMASEADLDRGMKCLAELLERKPSRAKLNNGST